jgi:hypothetical protein
MVQASHTSALGFLRKALLKIPGAPLDVNCLCVLEHQGLPGAVPHGFRGKIQVRDAVPADVENLARCQGDAASFATRFQAGDHCAVAICDRRIVGYEWFCDKTFHIEARYRYRVVIPQDTLYGYDAFVSEDYRGRRVWKGLQSEYLRQLMLRLGRSKICVMVDQGNSVSMSAHIGFGYRPKARVLVAKAFGKTVCRTMLLHPLPPAKLEQSQSRRGHESAQ